MKQEKLYILTINPGSTTTKIAIYENRILLHEKKFTYDSSTLAQYRDIPDQKDFRLKDILDYLQSIDFPLSKLSAVVGRGGILVPVKSGAYIVNELMIDRVRNRPFGPHASNLGAMLAYDISLQAEINAYIYDGVTMDEMTDVARITGIAEIERYSRVHALNMRAVAMKTAENMGRKYQDVNFIVGHIGGGITFSMHEKGRMVDVVLDNEGPFSPERAGRILSTQFLNYCRDHEYDLHDANKELRGRGGLVSLLGTNNEMEVEDRATSGDKRAALVLEAMIYQSAKAIGELATVVCGDVDAIILTGAIARSDIVVPGIEKRVNFIAPIKVCPGEEELESLAYGILRVLLGVEEAHIYDKQTDDQDKVKILY